MIPCLVRALVVGALLLGWWAMGPPVGAGSDVWEQSVGGKMDGPIPVELLPVVPEPWLIVVRRSEQVLYLYQQGVLIRSYPVSTGKADTITPLGWWKVVDKAAIGEPGVFGTRWMRFDRYNRAKGVYEWYPQSAPFGIHGTNEPDKIGTPVSAGCIRLRNPQVEELYDLVPIGTHVLVID